MSSKNKIFEIVANLEAQRKTDKRDISLRSFLTENKEYKDLSVEKLYHDAGINSLTTVETVLEDSAVAPLMAEIILDGVKSGMGVSQREKIRQFREGLVSQSTVTSDGGTTFLTPEMITDPIRVGSVQSSFFNELFVEDVPVTSDSVTMPKIELTDAELKEKSEGSTIETTIVTYGKKKVPIRSRARGIKMSYEAIRRHSLSFLRIFLEDLGKRLGSRLNQDFVNVLVNGDQVDGSESAGVIGVTTPGVLAYKDVTRAFIRMGLIGRVPTAIVASEEMANDWLNMPEVKNRQQGTSLLASTLKTMMPSELPVYIGINMDSDQLELVDTSQAVAKLTEVPLLTETGKIISKQLEETYVSTTTGFGTIQRDARLIIDKSVLFADFPEWIKVR